jgi:hypothetical protein
MKQINLRMAFCAQARCRESAFERAFFWRGLYRHAVPLAFFIRLLAPAFFREDQEFIRWLGGDHSLAEVMEDIDRFEYGNRVRHHWLRTGCRIQISPERVAALARRYLPV